MFLLNPYRFPAPGLSTLNFSTGILITNNTTTNPVGTLYLYQSICTHPSTGQVIDALVVYYEASSTGPRVSTFDSTALPYVREDFFQPNITWVNSPPTPPPAYVSFHFQFIVSGSYSGLIGSINPTEVAVTNNEITINNTTPYIKTLAPTFGVNSYDIDGIGPTRATRQAVSFSPYLNGTEQVFSVGAVQSNVDISYPSANVIQFTSKTTTNYNPIPGSVDMELSRCFVQVSETDYLKLSCHDLSYSSTNLALYAFFFGPILFNW